MCVHATRCVHVTHPKNHASYATAPCPPSPALIPLSQSRFLGEPEKVGEVLETRGEKLDTETADDLGLVTYAPDDIDWDD
ncbi:unnamed protein product, partial [Discosporangium mesarthrocarpum]